MIKPGLFGITVAADNRRLEFDFCNEQILYTNRRPDLLFIGDSITQLWDLYAYFGVDKFIVNRGISGDSSPYLAKRFDADCVQLNPRKAILMIGTNDIARTDADPWWRKSGESAERVLSDYQSNIFEILEKCSKSTTELILCSVIPSDIAPPFDKEVRWEMTKKMNLFLQAQGKPFVNYHDALTDDGKTLRRELSPDGIHPNARGYEIMAGVLKTMIRI